MRSRFGYVLGLMLLLDLCFVNSELVRAYDDSGGGSQTPAPPILECWAYVSVINCYDALVNAGIDPRQDVDCGPCEPIANGKISCKIPIHRQIYRDRWNNQAPLATGVQKGQFNLGEAVVYCGEGWYCATECEVLTPGEPPSCIKGERFWSVIPFRVLQGDCKVGEPVPDKPPGIKPPSTQPPSTQPPSSQPPITQLRKTQQP